MSSGSAPFPRRTGRTRVQWAMLALPALLVTAILAMLVVDRLFFDSGGTTPGGGSGVPATQARSLPPFHRLVLSGANNVVVRLGATQSVVVHADSNLLRRVTTRVRAGRLVIGTTPGSLNARSPMYVTVTRPSLDGVLLRGQGNISVEGVDGGRLDVALPGSGNITASGTTTTLDVTVSGTGTAMLGGLIARDARAALSGDGTIMLNATHRLSADISGGGTIVYGGNPPHVTRRVAGGGTIVAR